MQEKSEIKVSSTLLFWEPVQYMYCLVCVYFCYSNFKYKVPMYCVLAVDSFDCHFLLYWQVYDKILSSYINRSE